MATISKSVPRNLSRVGIPRVRSFCIKSIPSDTTLPVVESRLHSLTTDAFQQSLKHWELLYAFPPFSMIGKVLLKVKAEEAYVILITTSWPAQPWYSQILELSVTKPLLLPQSSNILVNPQGQVQPLVMKQTLGLVAWKVSGRAWPWKEF